MNDFTLNISGNLLSLKKPIVMGILNLTDDSFYDGGKFSAENKTLMHVEKMLTEGASIIDIGAQSTRPGAKLLINETELLKVVPMIQSIQKEFPQAIISVDTFYADVAKAAVDAGAAIINDISAGGIDPNLFQTVAQLNVPYVLMHSRGTPKTMQSLTTYNNVVTDLFHFFTEKIFQLHALGVNDIIVDVGFGFAKTTEQNFELLNQLEFFKQLNKPILTGVSRKGMIYKTLKTTAQEALNGTTVLNTIALLNGAHILRVHDVKEAIEAIQLIQQMKVLTNNTISNS